MKKWFFVPIAFVIAQMVALANHADSVKPQSVIASHANEAATEEGKVIPGTKTDEFIKATEIPVYIPLSGQKIEFNGSGGCVAGC